MNNKAKLKQLLSQVDQIKTDIPEEMNGLARRGLALKNKIKSSAGFFVKDKVVDDIGEELKKLHWLIEEGRSLKKAIDSMLANIGKIKIPLTNKAQLIHFTGLTSWLREAKENCKNEVQFTLAKVDSNKDIAFTKDITLKSVNLKIKKINALVTLINKLTSCVEEYGRVEQVIAVCDDMDHFLSILPESSKANEIDIAKIEAIEEVFKNIKKTVKSSSKEISSRLIEIDQWLAELENIKDYSVLEYKKDARELQDNYASGEVVGLEEKIKLMLEKINSTVIDIRLKTQTEIDQLFIEFRENCPIQADLSSLYDKLYEDILTPRDLKQWKSDCQGFNLQFDNELGLENGTLQTNLESRISGLPHKLKELEVLKKSEECQKNLFVLQKQFKAIEGEGPEKQNAPKKILLSLIDIRELIVDLENLGLVSIRESEAYQQEFDKTQEKIELLNRNRKSFSLDSHSEKAGDAFKVEIDINRFESIDYPYLAEINATLEQKIKGLCTECSQQTELMINNAQEIKQVLTLLSIDLPLSEKEFDDHGYYAEVSTFLAEQDHYNNLSRAIEAAVEPYRSEINQRKNKLQHYENNDNLEQYEIEDISQQIDYLSSWEKDPSLLDLGLLDLLSRLQQADSIIEVYAAVENDVRARLIQLEKKLSLYESAYPRSTNKFFFEVKQYTSGLIKGCDLKSEQWILCENQLQKADLLLSQLDKAAKKITLYNLNENLKQLNSRIHGMDSNFPLCKEAKAMQDNINEQYHDSLPSKTIIQNLENLLKKMS